MEQTTIPDQEQASPSGHEPRTSEAAKNVGVPYSLWRTARYISAIFSPLLIPTYAVAVAMWITPLNTTPENVRFIACMFVLFITGGIPMAMLLTLLRLGRITDIDISDRRQRTLPTLLISLCYVAAGIYMWRISAPWWMIMFFAAAFVVAMVCIVISRRWKVSCHSTAIGGVLGMVIWLVLSGLTDIDPMPWVTGMVIMAGIVGTARVILGAHDTMQVLAGWILGAVITYFILCIPGPDAVVIYPV
mgnify:CR=1 FL=1